MFINYMIVIIMTGTIILPLQEVKGMSLNIMAKFRNVTKKRN